MQNKLIDLNNHLFAQLERLLDDDVCKDKESSKMEIDRARTVCEVSKQVIDVHRVQLEGVELACQWNLQSKELPKTLGIEVDNATR